MGSGLVLGFCRQQFRCARNSEMEDNQLLVTILCSVWSSHITESPGSEHKRQSRLRWREVKTFGETYFTLVPRSYCVKKYALSKSEHPLRRW